MATLGIQINANLITGRITSYTKNDGSWTRKISDDRDNITMFPGITNQDTLICLRYIEEGVLVRVMVPKFGRGQNASVVADIFIPSDVIVPGAEVVKIINVVSAEMHNEQLNIPVLDKLFVEEYDIRQAIHQVTPVNNGRIAVREYGEGTELLYQLSKLLDTKYIYQPQYMPYQYIFLLDKSRRIEAVGVQQLNDFQLIESVEFHPIKSIDGFTPYIGENVFINPICVYQGEKVNVIWKKENYRDIVKTYTINKTCKLPAIDQSEYERLINYSLVEVMDAKTRKPVEKYDLIVNGKRLCPKSPIAVSEDILRDTEIKVYADGYNDYKSTHDVTRRVTIFLNPKTYTYNFSVETSVVEGPIKFQLESLGRLNNSPLEGYEIYNHEKPSESRDNLLVYNPLNKAQKRKTWIIRLICFVVGLVLGVFAAAYVANETIDELKSKQQPKEVNHSKYSAAQSDQQKEETKKPENNYDLIIEYMDNQIKWVKTDLDKYPEIVKLWDALNTYDFDNIKKYREPLKNSVKFKALISAIENKKREDYPETYNNPGDLEISIDKYIEKIKTPKPSQSTAAPKPKEKKAESKPRNEFGRNK